MATVIRLAKEEDHTEIVRLLQEAKVNAAGVDKHSTRFLVVEKQEGEQVQIVGTAGVELYGKRALLRSLVLQSGAGNARAGVEVVRVLLAFVQEQQVSELYLSTRAPSLFFEQLGFSEIGRDALPDDIRDSEHLQGIDREAVMMVHRVS